MSELTNQVEESPFSIKAFDHAQRVAKMLSSSTLIPKEYQGNIQNTMIALEMSNRMGASPLMVMQNLYIVHGKPGWSSTFIIAGLNACKRFSTLKFRMSGAGMERSCVAHAKDLEDGDILESPEITMSMAKAEGWLDKTGSKWKTMPDLMLRYRAAAFFGRLYAPEIMMGMQTNEEIVDISHSVVDTPAKDHESERIVLMINDAKTVDELKTLEPHVKEGQLDLYTVKMDELKAKS